MSMKTNSIVALFVVLSIILAIKPRFINDIYNSILGRIVLIAVIIFLAMNNVTLGLLVVLVLIVILNVYGTFTEGMENIQTPDTVGQIVTSVDGITIGEENVPQTGGIQVLTKDAVNAKKLSELKAQAASGITSTSTSTDEGVDQTDITAVIRPKPSNSIAVDKSTLQSPEVSAFTPSMVTNSSSLTEGFCPCAASV